MARLTKKPKLIYFLAGPVPTDEQREEAIQLDREYDVCFRNANHIGATEMIEKFDELAGEIPERYRAAAEAKEGTLEDACNEILERNGGKPAKKSEWKPNA